MCCSPQHATCSLGGCHLQHSLQPGLCDNRKLETRLRGGGANHGRSPEGRERLSRLSRARPVQRVSPIDTLPCCLVFHKLGETFKNRKMWKRTGRPFAPPTLKWQTPSTVFLARESSLYFSATKHCKYNRSSLQALIRLSSSVLHGSLTATGRGSFCPDFGPVSTYL